MILSLCFTTRSGSSILHDYDCDILKRKDKLCYCRDGKYGKCLFVQAVPYQQPTSEAILPTTILKSVEQAAAQIEEMMSFLIFKLVVYLFMICITLTCGSLHPSILMLKKLESTTL